MKNTKGAQVKVIDDEEEEHCEFAAAAAVLHGLLFVVEDQFEAEEKQPLVGVGSNYLITFIVAVRPFNCLQSALNIN